MARIVGGIGISHTPSMGMEFEKSRAGQASPEWRPWFEALEPVKAWLARMAPDQLIVVYNDHLNQFTFEAYPTFAIGVACLPMVGMAVGASNAARARRVAWTGGAVSAVITGIVGLVVVAVPDVWATWFTSDPAVLESARSYLRWSGLGYGFFGLGLCLYFASQGAGQVLGPVLAGTSRLLVVAAGGWWLASISAPQWMMFALIGVAMTVYGLATAFAVYLTTWGSQARKG